MSSQPAETSSSSNVFFVFNALRLREVHCVCRRVLPDGLSESALQSSKCVTFIASHMHTQGYAPANDTSAGRPQSFEGVVEWTHNQTTELALFAV